MCTIMCIAKAPLTFMESVLGLVDERLSVVPVRSALYITDLFFFFFFFKILSDPMVNQTIGSSVEVNMSVKLSFRICFLSVFYQINTK